MILLLVSKLEYSKLEIHITIWKVWLPQLNIFVVTIVCLLIIFSLVDLCDVFFNFVFSVTYFFLF